jgi:hypothetical protein
MTHIGGPGPQIMEKRPKAPRRCLNCDKLVRTTVSARLCSTCSERARHLAGGVGDCAVPVAERGRVRRLPAP